MPEEEMRQAVEGELHRQFRPEFLNRIDDVIVFHSLDLKQIKQIIGIQLKGLAKIIEARGITLEISDPAKERLAEEGYDPAFGARPLKRALQKLIVDPLAIRLLEGKFKPGDTVFVRLSDDGELELSLEPEKASVN
jgi:ATP-dependent Clp protease ATP-binding subunit ClpB